VGVDSFRFIGINSFELFFDKGRGIKGQFTCTFSTKNLSSPCPQPFPYPSFSCSPSSCPDFDWVLSDSVNGWRHFWQDGGAVDFSGATDYRAKELERRSILSQYLVNAQCTGSLPPQETGLSCNSWYGKFHLEMHILHSGWLPLWGHSKRLERSLPFYKSILGKAKENAARNGFIGARWPKMIGPDGIDSPSWIATLLIWQQPHILYFLELMRKAKSTCELQQRFFMEEYWELVYETALFMFDFPQLNPVSGRFDLTAPIIPAQEEFAPESVHNPVFELCYWMFGLDIAVSWAKELGKARSVYSKWEDVRSSLATVPMQNGLFPAHQNCFDTFTKFNKDHPSMLYAYGFIPCDQIDKSTMSATVDKVLKCWDKNSLWGWDFALCAMTLTRLGRPEDAIDILLADTAKNSYTVSGNNFQRGRSDLPLYLPGNGSLLLALAMMLSGYREKQGKVGFPNNKRWDDIVVEGVGALPY
ncbi:MAG: hypothetical protein LBD23_19785, partial [Oscillospiraceae bacterium]|nr:hypothetical protein [Oscillospiraceae bacterium]